MDEGFASFVSALCKNEIMQQNKQNPFESAYQSYYGLAASGKEQPQTTHSDRYDLNAAYGITAYDKGAVFLSQLGYVSGQEDLMKTIRNYYKEFKFKHPTPNDFIRVAEKTSGMELDWYLMDWTQTTNTIDYGIKEVAAETSGAKVTLERIGLMPMPMDILVVYKDGERETFYAPLRMMRGEKENPYPDLERTLLPDWPWAYSSYEFSIDKPLNSIKAIVLDPSQLMADVNWENNIWNGP
jgi:aminopeptidase N